MGDIVALVEDVTRNIDVDEARKLAERVQTSGRFDLSDFRAQLSQMRKMGGLAGMLDKLPTQLTGGQTGALDAAAGR